MKRLRILRGRGRRETPPMLAYKSGPGAQVVSLEQRNAPLRRKVARGDWFGLYTPSATNNTFFLNRGRPFVLEVQPNADETRFSLLAGMGGRKVEAGESRRYALLSINDPLTEDGHGPRRYARLRHDLKEPPGLEVVQGRRMETLGFVEIESQGAVAELRIPRPERSLGFTLPVRIAGLNPNWSAGVYQLEGYTAGYYTDGARVYSPLGMDFEEKAHLALFPGRADMTHVRAGHPVVCSADEVKIKAIPRVRDDGAYDWRVTANNPSEKPVTATFRRAMAVRGLDLEKRELTLAPGGYRVLEE